MDCKETGILEFEEISLHKGNPYEIIFYALWGYGRGITRKECSQKEKPLLVLNFFNPTLKNPLFLFYL